MMDLSNFYGNLYAKDKPVFKIGCLIGALFIVNYLGFKSDSSGAGTPIAFVVLEIALLALDPLYGFLFALTVHIDIMSCLVFNYIGPLSLLSMFYVFFINGKLFKEILDDKKVKILVYISFALGAYVALINIGLISGFTKANYVVNMGFIFGFLVILPAYYFTINRPRDFFTAIVVINVIFILLFYMDVIMGTHLFKLDSSLHSQESTMERLAGYNVRQFAVFFFYLLPAIMLAPNLKTIPRYVFLFIGIFSFLVLVLAFYRLAMFYTIMGMLLSFWFIRKYADVTKLWKYLLLLIVFGVIVVLFFGKYIVEMKKIISITIDYFNGTGQDVSSDARFGTQKIFLTNLFYSSPFLGIGLVEMVKYYQFDLWGFVDFPFLGTLAAFGIIGMSLYYIKFYFMLSGTKRGLSHVDLSREDPFLVYFYFALKAYLISLITFRLIYVSWEFTYDYMQAELGLFAGVFLALHRVLAASDEEDVESEENENEEAAQIAL